MNIKKISSTSFIFSTIAICHSLLILNSCNSKPKIDCKIPEVVTYTIDIAPVIEEKCFKCHAPEVYKKKASRNKIYDYLSLKEMGESGQLIGSITHARGFIAMPYKKESKIDSCAIELISEWVNSGMKK